MAEICHLENRYDVIFFCQGRSDLDKISQTGATEADMSTVDCADMVEIETTSRIPIWRTFGRIQWHISPEPHATLRRVVTWQIQCHVIPDPRATLQSERIPSVILEIVFAVFYFLFLNAVWALASGEFRIVFDTLVLNVEGVNNILCQRFSQGQ